MIQLFWVKDYRCFFILLALFVLVFSNCAPQKSYIQLPENYYPLFIDDADTASLLTAIEHQFDYLRNRPPDQRIHIGKRFFSPQDLIESLELFQTIVKKDLSPFELDEAIKENFHVYQSTGRKNRPPKKILLTGYYEPLFQGSLTREEPFVYPLYRVPDSLLRRKNGAGKTEIGRSESDGTFHSFWSRREIENKDILNGYEIAYLRDPFDAYLLHVQGSGRIQLPDGTTRAVHFGGSNGRTYNSLGKLFVDDGILKLEDVSIPRMRSYFSKHPEEITRMLHHNPRYIFFRWGDDKGPKGSLGHILTPGRSIALDQSLFPVGTPGYLISRRPVLNDKGEIDHWQDFSRFVLPQDSGSAIKGAGRIDLFWGAGIYAETAAQHMKETGQYFFLIKKQF